MGRKTGAALGRRAALLAAAWLLAAQSPSPPAPSPPAPSPPAPAPPVPAPPVPASPGALAPAAIHHLAPGEAAGVLGAEVVSAKGEQIGRIVDVIVDQAGHPRAAVIDFGGFMGIGNRKIAVDWKSLHFSAGQIGGAVVCDLTPDQIKATPEYSETSDKPASIAAPSHQSPVAPPPAAPAGTPAGTPLAAKPPPS